MIADKIIARVGSDDFRSLFAFPILLFYTFSLFLSGFLCRRRQLQLDFPVKGGKFRLQPFQFILLAPCLSGNLLQYGQVRFVGFVLCLVLLHNLRYALQCVQEIHCRRFRISHRHLTVVVPVFVMPLHDKTVLGSRNTVFQCRFADYIYRDIYRKNYVILLYTCVEFRKEIVSLYSHKAFF